MQVLIKIRRSNIPCRMNSLSGPVYHLRARKISSDLIKNEKNVQQKVKSSKRNIKNKAIEISLETVSNSSKNKNQFQKSETKCGPKRAAIKKDGTLVEESTATRISTKDQSAKVAKLKKKQDEHLKTDSSSGSGYQLRTRRTLSNSTKDKKIIPQSPIFRKDSVTNQLKSARQIKNNVESKLIIPVKKDEGVKQVSSATNITAKDRSAKIKKPKKTKNEILNRGSPPGSGYQLRSRRILPDLVKDRKSVRQKSSPILRKNSIASEIEPARQNKNNCEPELITEKEDKCANQESAVANITAKGRSVKVTKPEKTKHNIENANRIEELNNLFMKTTLKYEVKQEPDSAEEDINNNSFTSDNVYCSTLIKDNTKASNLTNESTHAQKAYKNEQPLIKMEFNEFDSL